MSETVHKFSGIHGMRTYTKVRPVGSFLEHFSGLHDAALIAARDNEVEQAWLNAILDPYANPWHLHVEVVEGYMPPYPSPMTQPTIQVRWGSSYLRKGGGPFQPWFWDIYGHEFTTVQQAWLAVAQAPAPPRLTYLNGGSPERSEPGLKDGAGI